MKKRTLILLLLLILLVAFGLRTFQLTEIPPGLTHDEANHGREAIGILDGDLLAVQSSKDAKNGQIVVARLGDDVTVKRYRQEGKVVWVMPENQDFEPLRVDLEFESLIIEGIVVGVVRQEAGRA